MAHLLSIGQVARLLGVSRATAYRMAAAGELPVTRTRGRQLRVTRAALDDWLAEQAAEAVADARRRAA